MNNNTLKPHQEILDETRQQVLTKLLPYLKDFVLGGGTALALQLNHRKSFDFDFFSSSPINKNLLETVSHHIEIGNISVDTADELTFFTREGVKVTFLHYPFPHAYPLETLENGLQLFSIKDIAIKKAYTIGRRGEYRDYFDLYTILRNNYLSLGEVILKAKEIYGSVFEEKLFLQQLVYFGDLLNFEIIPAISPTPDKQTIKGFFEGLVKNYIEAASTS